MSESELQTLITKAKEKISIYQSLISKVSTLLGDLNNCVTNLNEASSSIGIGLVSHGKPADDGKFNEIAENLSNAVAKLSNVVTVANTEISHLNDDITAWGITLDRLKREREAAAIAAQRKLEQESENDV